jgi:hypothetical protein
MESKMKSDTYNYLTEEINKRDSVIIKFDAHMNVGDPFVSKGELDLDPAENIYDAQVLRIRFYDNNSNTPENLDNFIFEKEYFDLEYLAHDMFMIQNDFDNVYIDPIYDLGQDFINYLEEKRELVNNLKP